MNHDAVDVFLLGAGRPIAGTTPAALKKIARGTRALDWQLDSFTAIPNSRVHFLGGYHIDEVVASYPQLDYTVIPEWEGTPALRTFLKAPFSGAPAFVSYADTVFRKDAIESLFSSKADIAFAVDTGWKERYRARTSADIDVAETTPVEFADRGKLDVEFTGLIFFDSPVVSRLRALRDEQVGTSLIQLVRLLEAEGFSVEAIDVSNRWAEFNSPKDISRFVLGTKAETLDRLAPLVKCSHIGKQVNFTSKQWAKEARSVLKLIRETFPDERLVVRSSARSEDSWDTSNAGGYDSFLDVDGGSEQAISRAIDSVILSYNLGGQGSGEDQVLVQAFVQQVAYSGVVFTCGLETGAPYFRINFDDTSQSTESVTSGTEEDLRTVLVYRNQRGYLNSVEPKLLPVLDGVAELEALLGFDKLDIEFAVDQAGILHIFQVRPITVDHSKYEVKEESVALSIEDAIGRFSSLQMPTPLVHGDYTIFGNMPDWNPAEIIGTRPKALAFSLYRHLITNDVWATQRAEYGYRDVRPHPLIVSFCGHPYVDVRASLNSFIPACLDAEFAGKLARRYLDLLAEKPHYHDKIEFEVAITVWTPSYSTESSERLAEAGFDALEIGALDEALKAITRTALTRLNSDIGTIDKMLERRTWIEASELGPLEKMTALLDDCRRYGTLAFSHAARAGFVATSFLKSFVSTEILSEQQREGFMRSIVTVAGLFEQDKHAAQAGSLSQQDLILRYGHLRPGTYDATASAYWESPDRYLAAEEQSGVAEDHRFVFPDDVRLKFGEVLDELGSDIGIDAFIEFLIKAIQAREAVKFEFTRNLSRALDACLEYGITLGIERDDIVFLEYQDFELLKLGVLSPLQLPRIIEEKRRQYAIAEIVELPQIITRREDFYCFERLLSQPNFVTTNAVEAPVVVLSNAEAADVEGSIVLIPQADPGYDWLFGHGISGLITMYGGANSHMAIRAAEMDLPAAIGVGEKLYEKFSLSRALHLDCANHIIRPV